MGDTANGRECRQVLGKAFIMKMHMVNMNGTILINGQNEDGSPYNMLSLTTNQLSPALLELICAAPLMFQTLEHLRDAMDATIELAEIYGKDDIAGNLTRLVATIQNAQDIAVNGLKAYNERMVKPNGPN